MGEGGGAGTIEIPLARPVPTDCPWGPPRICARLPPRMAEIEDLSDRCLVVVADVRRWEGVFRTAIRTASLPDGRSMEPERVDPRSAEALASDALIDLLEDGAAALVDLEDVPPSLFALLAWHARARPASVVLLRPARVALPFELHEFPVRTYDPDAEEGASKGRVAVARLATLAADARARACPAGEDLTTTKGNRARRKRRAKNGVTDALRRAGRALLLRDPGGALAAMEEALRAEPEASGLLLRGAILHREAGRWPSAVEDLERTVAIDPESAPAWRELGIVRDRSGQDGAEDALRKAVDLEEDYNALVALSFLLGRRGEPAEALKLLERAIEVSEGQLNLVLTALVLRVARDRAVGLFESEKERVREVLGIRDAQARAEPPDDLPWSAFDSAQAYLLLGDAARAAEMAAISKPAVHASWETETFSQAIDAFDRAGSDVSAIRAALDLRPPRAATTTTSTTASVATAAAAAAAAAKAPPAAPRAARARPPGWYRENVPCATACPVGTDAGAYVTLTARREFSEAYRVARGPNPFASVCGRICAAPCEEACRRGRIDEPVAIRPIKRFLTERHGPESRDSRLPDVLDGSVVPSMEGEAYTSHLRKLGVGADSGRRVAVVGGGPAGLACAHDLAFLGHRVTLYEASDRLGGMMRHGIPEYRLPRDVLDLEISAILDLGVDVRLDEGLDSRRTLKSLLDAGTEAVFLASGASRGRDLDVEGGDLDGVVRAIEFLINVNNGFRMDLGSRVVVVGGGNVAIDVARTARLGSPPDLKPRKDDAGALAPALSGDALRSAVHGRASEVHVVARQPMGQWPAQKSVHGREEVDEAVREGVVFHPLRGIRRIIGSAEGEASSGRVTAVELAEVVQLTDERGRYSPVYGSHAAEVIPCDAVLLAVGQEPDLDYLAGTSTLRRTPTGLIEVDKKTLATSLPGVYAGGDAAFGPRTLIEAVAEGKRAARSIHAHLTGGRTLPLRWTFAEVHPRSVAPDDAYDVLPREDPGCTAVERRTGIAEVEAVFSEEQAVRQAKRCLSCHVQTVYDGAKCVACGRCTDVCPHRCLSLVPAGDVEAAGVDAATLSAAAGEGAPLASLVLMLKDEALCIRCGLCAERCPTGAMTMERFDLRVEDAATAGAAS